jgi:preprotein translocase subunit SecY
MYGGQNTHIPMKVLAVGVLPLIFAYSFMAFPGTIGAMFGTDSGFYQWWSTYMNQFSFWYMLVCALLIVVFAYFYTAIIVNPQMMADDLKRNGGFIPGVKPGKETMRYIDTVMTRITLPGSIFLAIVAILPAFAEMIGINRQFALFFGGTSLLILVGVVLDTLKQVESYLLLRHYDGLMKTGRIKGRY